MHTYTLIIILSVLTMLTMAFVVQSNNILSFEKRCGFTAVFAIIAVVAICEWTGVMIESSSQSYTRLLHIAAKYIEFSLAPLSAIVMAGVIDSFKRAKPMLPVVIAHAVLEFISIFTGFIFYVDENNNYLHGQFYFLYYAVSILCSAYMFLAFSSVSRRYQNRNVHLLWLIMVFMLLSIISHLIYSAVRIQWLGIAIASMLSYMYYNELIQQIDSLTGLLNRACYDAHVSNIKRPVGLLVFDVDRFKEINDTYGHHYGDVCLRVVSQKLLETYGRFGTCYRTGGDEFFAVLDKSKYDSSFKPDALNARFVAGLSSLREKDPNIPTVSIGYTYFDPSKESILDAVMRADSIMYYYKQLRKQKSELPDKRVIHPTFHDETFSG